MFWHVSVTPQGGGGAPTLAWGRGTYFGWGGGVPTLDQGWPPPWETAAVSTCYTAGGMSLAFTQDFPVTNCFWRVLLENIKFLWLHVKDSKLCELRSCMTKIYTKHRNLNATCFYLYGAGKKKWKTLYIFFLLFLLHIHVHSFVELTSYFLASFFCASFLAFLARSLFLFDMGLNFLTCLTLTSPSPFLALRFMIILVFGL